MKKCVKSQPEPSCLLDFRAANPGGTWEQFCDQDPDGYKSIRSVTRADQGCLCAYCEMKLEPNDEQIAHFHPKSDASSSHNWALDWANLWLACKGGSVPWLSNPENYLPPLPNNLSCDQYKGAKILDTIILAPHEFPAFPRLFRYKQWPDRIEICVDEDACTAAGINIDRVQQTIDQLNLNCARLASARLALYRPLERAIRQLRESNAGSASSFVALASKHLAKDPSGHWPKFFTLIRWRFHQAAEDYLQSIDYDG